MSGQIRVTRALPSLLGLLVVWACADSAAPPPSPPPPPPPSPRLLVGEWSVLRPAPIVQLQVHLLTSGKVLTWGHYGDPQIWDPVTGAFRSVPSPSLLFCAGHDFLPDGRLLVAGGHISDVHGLPNTNVFDPVTETWQALPSMAAGRWYPTNTTLPNGEVLTLSGTDTGGVIVPIPEVWNGTSWRRLTSASLPLPLYPRVFVAPDGRVFYAGEEQQSRYLDVSGTGQWTNGPLRKFAPARDYGSAVMYEPGKILYVGGGDPPTNTAEIIDLNQANPAWQNTGPMLYARRQMDATLLPTGDVLVTGGTSSGGFSNAAGAVHRAEIWHPVTGAWTGVASSAVTRIYHGTALLLPDARVLFTGSGDASGAKDERNYEVYSPPYLFQGARPAITGTLPARVTYGQTLKVETPDAAAIAKVTFIRFSSVTHAFDMGARLVPLNFSPAGRSVAVTFPSGPTMAPPGPYMLFLVNAAGVPSEARILLLN